MCNYRADQGKWQTADPLGYPDGYNNFAYCNNLTTISVDPYGQWTMLVGAVIGGVIGGVSGYITSGGDFDATVAGALGGVVGGALAGCGIPHGAMIGGAVAAGITTGINRFIDDGNMTEADFTDVAISATLGGLGGLTTNGFGDKVNRFITDLYSGSVSPDIVNIIASLSAGIGAELGNMYGNLYLDIYREIEDFIENNPNFHRDYEHE